MRSLVLYTIPIVFFATYACSLLDSNKTELEPGIVWGSQIEGISIGDDSTTIVQKLGPPSYTSAGDFVGMIFYYDEDTEYDLLTIAISKDEYLGLGVLYMRVWRPYNGKTANGVGLAMKWKDTMGKIPPPDKIESHPSGTVYNYYYRNNTIFTARYDSEEIIDMIGMARK